MSAAETHATVELLQRLIEQLGIVLLFTEHDMEVVFAVASRIIVMAEGRVIADGTPADVRGDAEVKRVYLGHQ
jgi:ABC-type branched-subunit amino acid transport system ATPase component